MIEKSELNLVITNIITGITKLDAEDVIGVKRESDGIWDSLNHIEIILQVESQFDIEFTTHEIESIVDLNSLIRVTYAKLK